MCVRPCGVPSSTNAEERRSRRDGAEAPMSDAAGMTGVAELQELLLATDTLQEFLGEVAFRAAAEVSPGCRAG